MLVFPHICCHTIGYIIFTQLNRYGCCTNVNIQCIRIPYMKEVDKASKTENIF